MENRNRKISMNTQFQFNDPDCWGAQFGSEVAAAVKEYTERKLAPLRISVANLEAKNAMLSAELAAHRSVKYMGVYRDGAEYSEGSLVTLHGSLFHANRNTKMIPGDGSRDWTLCVKRGRDGKDASK
jgi:hypothetical protein